VNVGQYVVSGVGIANTPYSSVALALLDESPVEDFSKVRSVETSPKSTLYHGIMAQMLEVYAVRRVVGGASNNANSMPVSKEDLSFAKHPGQFSQLENPIVTPRVCGVLRAVYKDSGGEARAIFDLVYTNSVARKRSARFGILSSGQLLDILRTIPFILKRFRFIHGDLKNAYYQFPIGPRLSRCCCIRIGDDLYEPLVLPMGFHEACGICQGIVFATILFREEGEDALGVGPAEYTCEDAPAVVFLDDGGFISLVYDSFLVVTSEERARDWEVRLRRNFNRVNGALKYLTLEPPTFSFLYCGVVLSMDGHGLAWSLDAESVRIWHLTANMELLPSPRTLYRLMGFLRFAAPVTGWQHRTLGEGTKAQSLLGEILEWDTLSVDPEVIEKVRLLVLQVTVNKSHPRSHIPVKRTRSQASFLAVDATPERWVIVLMRENNGSPEIVQWSFDDFRADKSYLPHARLDIAGGVPIEVAEAIAMSFGLDEGRRHIGNEDVIVIGGDNLSASLGFWKGFSRSDGIQSVIAHSTIPKQQPVIFVDIPTEENLADVKTRPKVLEKMSQKEIEEEINKRLALTWKRLSDGYRQWELTAKAFFYRHDVYNEGLAKKLGEFD